MYYYICILCTLENKQNVKRVKWKHINTNLLLKGTPEQSYWPPRSMRTHITDYLLSHQGAILLTVVGITCLCSPVPNNNYISCCMLMIIELIKRSISSPLYTFVHSPLEHWGIVWCPHFSVGIDWAGASGDLSVFPDEIVNLTCPPSLQFTFLWGMKTLPFGWKHLHAFTAKYF